MYKGIGGVFYCYTTDCLLVLIKSKARTMRGEPLYKVYDGYVNPLRNFIVNKKVMNECVRIGKF